MRGDRAHSDPSGFDKTPGRRRKVALAAGLGVVAGLLAWAGLEIGLIQPLASEADRLAAELQRVRDDNGRTEAMIANYEAFRREAESVEAEYAEALAAVPSEAELAAALADVERVTGASGVRLVAFEPAKATPKPPSPSPASGQELPASQPVVEARPVSVVIHTRYEPTQALLDRLATYPRLLTVESFSLKSHNSGAYTTEASMTLNCYFKSVPSTIASTAVR